MPIQLIEEQEEPIKKKKIKSVKATLVYPSTILPKRSRVHKVINSVKKDDIQQPILVRPHPTIPNHYETIDGHNRYLGLFERPDITQFITEQEPEITVDIRYGLSDADVFKLANIIHTRESRNNYENSEYHVKWIETKESELGKKEGALTEVAKELITENQDSPLYSSALASKQSLLSQEQRIYKLFKNLEQKHPDLDFNILKPLAINKLYELTKLLDNPTELVKIVKKLIKNPDMKLDSLKRLTEEDQFIEPKTSWVPQIQIPQEYAEKFKSKLLTCFTDKKLGTSLTNTELVKNGVMCLIDLYNQNPQHFELEIEKDKRKKTHIISKIWLKSPID